MAAGEKEETHRIKYLKIDGLDKKRTFYMVYSKNIRLSPIAEAFRDLVIDYRDRNWQQDKVFCKDLCRLILHGILYRKCL